MRYEHQTIPGQPPSKSNSNEIHVLPSGRRSIGKTPEVEIYENRFRVLCTLRNRKIASRFRLDMDVWFSSDRSDLDNSLKVVLDSLQYCNAIVNDRQCVEIRARKHIDRENPRVEFDIEEVEWRRDGKPTKAKRNGKTDINGV